MTYIVLVWTEEIVLDLISSLRRMGLEVRVGIMNEKEILYEMKHHRVE